MLEKSRRLGLADRLLVGEDRNRFLAWMYHYFQALKDRKRTFFI